MPLGTSLEKKTKPSIYCNTRILKTDNNGISFCHGDMTAHQKLICCQYSAVGKDHQGGVLNLT